MRTRNYRLKTRIVILIVLLACIITGCSYKVPTDVSPAVNIYSSYEDIISGKFYIVLENNLLNVQREIKPSSYVCSAHSFPINAGNAFANSAQETIQHIFSEVVLLDSMPTVEYFHEHGGDGVVIVGLKRFEPRIRFVQGFWSNTAIANSDLVFEITVKDKSGNTVLNTTAGGSHTSEGEGGSFCSEGSDLLSQNLHESTREAMERLAERLSNSLKVRQLANHTGAENKTSLEVAKPLLPSPVSILPAVPSAVITNCFEGESDKFPDNDSINMAEALDAAKCAAIKVYNSNYSCPNTVSVEHEFRKQFGENYEMRIVKKSKNKILMKICLPD